KRGRKARKPYKKNRPRSALYFVRLWDLRKRFFGLLERWRVRENGSSCQPSQTTLDPNDSIMNDDIGSCLNYSRWLDRREFLGKMGTGLGSIALACLLGEESAAGSKIQNPKSEIRNSIAAHFPPRAKRVVQIFCPGAVSQMDTFEYKPELQKRH